MRLFIIPYEIIGVTLILRFCNELVSFCLISAQDEIIISFKRWRSLAVTRKDIRDGRVCLSIATMLICLLSGTLFFWGNEHWTLLNAFYWASCTMTASCFGAHYDSCHLVFALRGLSFHPVCRRLANKELVESNIFNILHICLRLHFSCYF